MNSSALVDPQAAGRQLGALSVGLGAGLSSGSGLPVCSTRALPYAQIAQGHGRTIVIVGHTRPDDLDAVLVIAELMRELRTHDIDGCVRLISTLDPSLACKEDNKVQRAINETAIAGADLVIELGNQPNDWDWCGAAITHHSSKQRNKAALAEEARVAFGAPMSLKISDQSDNCSCPDINLEEAPPLHPLMRSMDSPASLATACRLRGIAHLSVCVGTSVSATERQDMLRIGCRNVLVACKVLNRDFTLRASRLFRCQTQRDSVLSPASGALQMLSSPGKEVYRGDLLAQIVDPREPWRAPRPIQVPRDGVVMACRRGNIVAPGEGIALLADEIQG